MLQAKIRAIEKEQPLSPLSLLERLRSFRKRYTQRLLHYRKAYREQQALSLEKLESICLKVETMHKQAKEHIAREAQTLAAQALEHYTQLSIDAHLPALNKALQEVLQFSGLLGAGEAKPRIHCSSTCPQELRTFFEKEKGWEVVQSAKLSRLELVVESAAGSLEVDLSGCLPNWRRYLSSEQQL